MRFCLILVCGFDEYLGKSLSDGTGVFGQGGGVSSMSRGKDLGKDGRNVHMGGLLMFSGGFSNCIQYCSL